MKEPIDKKVDKNLKKRFTNTYKFYDHGINILLLRKYVYSHEYINYSETFNETSLPKKEYFYSHINMEDNTDVDYAHTRRVWKDFQSDTLLLVDIFNNFCNCRSKYMRLILFVFFLHQGYHGKQPQDQRKNRSIN